MSESCWIQQKENYCDLITLRMRALNPWVYWVQKNALVPGGESKNNHGNGIEEEQVRLSNKELSESWQALHRQIIPLDMAIQECEKTLLQNSYKDAVRVSGDALDISNVGPLTTLVLNKKRIHPEDPIIRTNGFDRKVIGSWMHIKLLQTGHKTLIKMLNHDDYDQKMVWVLMSMYLMSERLKSTPINGSICLRSKDFEPPYYQFIIKINEQLGTKNIITLQQQWSEQLREYLKKDIGVGVYAVPEPINEKHEKILGSERYTMSKESLPLTASYGVDILCQRKSLKQTEENKIQRPWQIGAKNAWVMEQRLEEQKSVHKIHQSINELKKQVLKKAEKCPDALVSALAMQLTALEYLKEMIPLVLDQHVSVPMEQLHVQKPMDRHLNSTAYALVRESGGYVSGGNNEDGGVASAKLFSSLKRAKLSAKSHTDIAAIVKVRVQPVQIVEQMDARATQSVQQAISSLEQQQLEHSLEDMPWEQLQIHLKRLGVGSVLIEQIQEQIQKEEPAKPRCVRRM